MAGVGTTPPNVLGIPNPASSDDDEQHVGRAFLGGTTLGAHQASESSASSLITPPNVGLGAGSCLPLMVVVAPGEPGVPVVSMAAEVNRALITRLVVSSFFMT